MATVRAARRTSGPPGFADGLAIPLAAFVVTAPVLAGMAGSVSLVSVLTNVLTGRLAPGGTAE